MKRIAFIAAGLLFCLGISVVRADVTVERVVKSDGFKGMGASEGTEVSRIQGLKWVETTSMKFTGAIFTFMPGGGEKKTITRVDKGVIWELDDKQKSYTETAIAPLQSAETPTREAEQTRVRVTKSEFQVSKTGASATIHGFPCEEYLVHWLIEMEDLETKTKMENSMETRLWTTPATTAIRRLQAEQDAFWKAYTKKTGVNLSSDVMRQFGLEAFTASGASQQDMEREFAKFQAEMAKIKGYPIRRVVHWKTAGEKASKAERQEATDGQDPLAALGDLFGGFKGAIGKKRGEAPSSPTPTESLFSSTTEVKAITIDPLPASIFEIPSGYVRR